MTHKYIIIESLIGSIDANGDMFFDESDIGFDSYVHLGTTWKLEATDDGTGTFCPNSGSASITFSMRIKVTTIKGVSIAGTPCFIEIDDGNPVTLTTDNSGIISGTRFNSGQDPVMVASVHFEDVTGFCTTQQKDDIRSALGASSDGRIYLQDVTVNPSNLTGDGC